jgi:ElaB/YqjD/DUF883 family membrane-anchored ribosome-binding protein
MSSQATTAPSSSLHADSDLQRTISGAEDMLAQAAAETGDKAVELRNRAAAQLQALRERLTLAQDLALESSRRAARDTDIYVHQNPWRVIAAAAAAGMIVGLLINRR